MKWLIKNVNVFDGYHAECEKHVSIVVEDNLVTEILSGEVSHDQFLHIKRNVSLANYAKYDILSSRNLQHLYLQYSINGMTTTRTGELL